MKTDRKFCSVRIFRIFIPTLLVASLTACGGEHMNLPSIGANGSDGFSPAVGSGSSGANPSLGTGSDGGAARIGYRQTILPIIQQHCAACHNPSNPALNWQDYATAFANREKIKTHVFVLKDMPLGGKLDESLRKEIADWVDQGAPENESGQSEGHPAPAPVPSPIPAPAPAPIATPSQAPGPAPVPAPSAVPTVSPTPVPTVSPSPMPTVPTAPAIPMPQAAASCLGCHGENGNPASSMFPRLAGQMDPYIQTELKAFKGKTRHDADAQFMAPVASGLTDADIEAVAKFFAAQTAAKAPAGDPVLIAKGKSLYENGIPAKNVMACASCHGQDAAGSVGPRLASQFGGYLVKQYQAFKAGTREEATMMPMVVQDLDPDSMDAIAAYLQSR